MLWIKQCNVGEGLAGSVGVEAGKKGWDQMMWDFRYLDIQHIACHDLDLSDRLARHGVSLHETHFLVSKVT